MSTYDRVMKSSWANATLFAESIPHLFHWDLAYLWMLEKVKASGGDDRQIPEPWRDRLEAWDHLLALFLTGGLEVQSKEITSPFIGFTRPYGVETVHWLTSPDGSKIGVLSPVVLVRPLPDYRREHRQRWPEHSKKNRPGELGHFMQLAAEELERGQSPSSFRTRLAEILRDRVVDASLAGVPAGDTVRVPMLKELRWTGGNGASSTEEVRLLIHDRHGNAYRKVFVPRCEHCNTPLLRDEDAEPVPVQGTQFEVLCPNETCGTTNVLDLEDFLIWYRDKPSSRALGDVIVWEPSNRTLEVPEHGFRPTPRVQGTQVHFAWNPAHVRGEHERRFLTLAFPGRDIRQFQLDDILYKKLLVPGDFSSFRGLPVRFEWAEALVAPHDIAQEQRMEQRRIKFSSVRLRGWPMPLTISFSGDLQIKKAPALGAGVYPDPLRTPGRWKWYRTFLDGTDRKAYGVRTPEGRSILPWLWENDQGAPSFFSIEMESDSNTGVLFFPERSSETSPPGTAGITIGVDFGTTNSTLYALYPGEQATSLTAEKNAVRPSRLTDAARWFASVEDISDDHKETAHTGDFLPGPTFGKNPHGEDLRDPYIIPSALWRLEHPIIRWSSKEPVDGVQAITGFKLEQRDLPRQDERRSFLRELLLITLPYVLSKAPVSASQVGNVRIGFSYPLAFGYQDRENMKQLLEELQTTLQTLTGLSFTFSSISESSACIQAYGAFNPGETFLVADMGGGTMDLALLTVGAGREYDVHQIGSVRYAGENFVSTVAARRDYGQNEWLIRDYIRVGFSQQWFGNNQEIIRTLNCFTTLAMEFLRTMVAAHLEKSPGQSVNMILVGNGWHLVEAFSAAVQNRGPERVFQEYYDGLTRKLGREEVSLHRSERLQNLPSSKHLVVIGALMNAAGPSPKHELYVQDGTELSQLPSGRDLRIYADDFEAYIKWHDLLGEGVVLEDLSQARFGRAVKEFDLRSLPPPTETWREQLLETFGVDDLSEIPYPEESELLHQMALSVQGSNDFRITEVPLQIILEQRWNQWLKE